MNRNSRRSIEIQRHIDLLLLQVVELVLCLVNVSRSSSTGIEYV